MCRRCAVAKPCVGAHFDCSSVALITHALFLTLREGWCTDSLLGSESFEEQTMRKRRRTREHDAADGDAGGV